MNEAERLRLLLDGEIDPSEIEMDKELYNLAERIYGRMALEEMGISSPEPIIPIEKENGNGIIHDVELPPLPPVTELPEITEKGPKRRCFVLIIGLLGLSLVSMNMVIGLGTILDICEDEVRDGPLEFSAQASYQGDLIHITWNSNNLQIGTNYTITWAVSQNGSNELVDQGSYNWTANVNSLTHSMNWPVHTPPFVFSTELKENDTVLLQDNGCIGCDESSTMSESNPMYPTCVENPRLIWINYGDLESVESWGSAGEGDLIDGALLMLFSLMTIFAIVSKKN